MVQEMGSGGKDGLDREWRRTKLINNELKVGKCRILLGDVADMIRCHTIRCHTIHFIGPVGKFVSDCECCTHFSALQKIK